MQGRIDECAGLQGKPGTQSSSRSAVRRCPDFICGPQRKGRMVTQDKARRYEDLAGEYVTGSTTMGAMRLMGPHARRRCRRSSQSATTGIRECSWLTDRCQHISTGFLYPLCRENMLHTRDIIKKIWDAQGYGNLAVWENGMTEVIEPGATPERDGTPPLTVFKPLALVGGFSMLDFALTDGELLNFIETAVIRAGGEIVRD
ncbi:MAG: hypothetical protein PWP08_254 [Methanofollis sp.]|nr:hypothetical protein [Methanofollis sp.]